MEDLVEQLWHFIELYGAEVAILSFVTIFAVGVIKIIFKKGFTNINTNVKKAVYETLSVVIAYSFTILWMYLRVAVFHISEVPFDFMTSLKAGSATLIAVKVMYPIYENYGIRTLVKIAGNFAVDLVKKKSKENEGENKLAENSTNNKEEEKPKVTTINL